MKRSEKINLVFLGFTSLVTGCGGGDYSETPNNASYSNQPRYNSKEECRKEWQDEKLCQANGSGYVGPRYYYYHGTGNAYAVYPDGSQRAVPVTAKAVHSDVAHQATSFKSSSGGSYRSGGFGSSARSSSVGG